MINIEFTTDNAAFGDDMFEEHYECVRILKEICKKLNSGYRNGSCIDINGNKVGEWELT